MRHQIAIQFYLVMKHIYLRSKTKRKCEHEFDVKHEMRRAIGRKKAPTLNLKELFHSQFNRLIFDQLNLLNRIN